LKKKHQYQTGEIIFDNNSIYIVAKKNLLKINKLQLEGKKTISAKEFIQGYKHYQGITLK